MSIENKNKTILIVGSEDEDIVSDAISIVLDNYKYNILKAKNVQGVMNIVKNLDNNKIDLLITDITIFRMNGCELCNWLNDRYPDMKILNISRYIDDPIAHSNALKEGIPSLLTPFSPQELVSKIRELLNS